MGTFTVSLKEAIELTGGSADTLENNIAKLVGGKIGLESYPIFDEGYRDHLTGMIVDHYWNREIGMESVDMFQLAMRRKMNEIMPYYNQLYQSTKIQYDPLSTIDIHTVSTSGSSQTATNDATNNTTNNVDSKSRSVSSETPQTMLAGNADYATGAADVQGTNATVSDATENSSSNVDAEANGDTTVSGYQGVSSELIMRYRESLINVDLMVINELEELFMTVWGDGDSFTTGGYFPWL